MCGHEVSCCDYRDVFNGVCMGRCRRSEDASSSARLNIGLYLNWNAQGEISLSGAKYGSGLGDVFVGNVLSAVLGDIINEETTRNLESYFCHDKLDYQEHAKTYPIAVETGADYYLICIGGVFI